MRTIIIGDLHGCPRTLQAMLSAVKPDPAQDRLILLGDLFDRGPGSWQVWQMVMQMAEGFGKRFVLLMGNHEAYWLNEHPSWSDRLLHRRVGKQATVLSFRQQNAQVSECLPWLREHAVTYYEDNLFQCVHAGIRCERPQDNDLFTLLHDHSVVPKNVYVGKLTVTGHIALPTACHFTGDGETVRELQEDTPCELPRTGVICIDTGCGKEGALTAMVIEDGRFTLTRVPQLEMT